MWVCPFDPGWDGGGHWTVRIMANGLGLRLESDGKTVE